jgi:hypothetical protein
MKDFFVSYNSADRVWGEWIAWQLEEAGYTTVLQAWDFRPGFNFVLEMQQAAAEATRIIAVLSPDYVAARFTQPEWAAGFAQDPTGERGALVPVRVRECHLKGLLPQIIYVDLVGLEEAAARDALLEGVRRGRAKPETSPTFPRSASRSLANQPSFPAYHEYMEDAIAAGSVIHRDAWSEGASEEEVAFKGLLRGKLNQSLDLKGAEDWAGIITLWAPLGDNAFFHVDNPEWQTRPFFRSQIHSAKAQLFIAHAQLGVHEWDEHAARAWNLLKEVLEGPPYAMKGGSAERLQREDARSQNLNYFETLRFAQEWLDAYGRVLALKEGSATEIANMSERIRERSSEIEYLLSLYAEDDDETG